MQSQRNQVLVALVANAITKESGLGGISVILKSCVEEMWMIEMDDEEN
jgi:hypothetical protein